MHHAGEDHVRAELPNESQQRKDRKAHSGSAECMHRDMRGHLVESRVFLCDETKVNFAFFVGEILGEQGGYALRAPSTEMWDEQEHLVLMRHGCFPQKSEYKSNISCISVGLITLAKCLKVVQYVLFITNQIKDFKRTPAEAICGARRNFV
jgi:hypothetical protein